LYFFESGVGNFGDELHEGNAISAPKEKISAEFLRLHL
jgi:hypothetical protein